MKNDDEWCNLVIFVCFKYAYTTHC